MDETCVCSQCHAVVLVKVSTEIGNTGVFYCDPCWRDDTPKIEQCQECGAVGVDIGEDFCENCPEQVKENK